MLLHGLHAEGGIAQVVAQQLPDVGGNDAGMYQLRAVVLCLLTFGQVEEVFLEGAVHVVADAGWVAQQLFDGVAAYFLAVGGEVGIDKLGRAVEDGTEEGGIYLGAYFVGCLEAGNVAVVELEATIEIGVEGRGREDGTRMDTGVEGVAQASHHGLVLGYAYRACRLGRLACLDVAVLNGVGRLDQELEHEARHFAAVQPVGRGVVEQGDMFGTLYEAVEVVGIDGVLVFDGGHAKGLAQVVGDEGCLASCLGQLALVEGEKDEVAEVEVARLEHTHDLQADGRLAVERYGGGSEQAAQQTLQGVGAQG